MVGKASRVFRPFFWIIQYCYPFANQISVSSIKIFNTFGMNETIKDFSQTKISITKDSLTSNNAYHL
jgi:hypothetical protein